MSISPSPSTHSRAAALALRWMVGAALGLLLVTGSGTRAYAASAADITTVQVVSGLDRPVAVVAAPGVAGRLFVVEAHTGNIRIVDLASRTIAATPFLTVAGVTQDREQGLLGLAFHPQFATNGFFYVHCCLPGGGGAAGHIQIRRYQATKAAGAGDFTTATTADPAVFQDVLAIPDPETNHNGGWLAFGPKDGLLYISVGDGGGGGDAHGSIGNAQDRNVLLGKILRLDVSSGLTSTTPYTIPSGNPFAGQAGKRGEIFAFGLRNPFRCSFDRQTGDLWIGDVGQGAFEEIDFNPDGTTGRNYGWRALEGFSAFTSETPVTAATAPVTAYPHDGTGTPITGIAVIGGYAYRGNALPAALKGTYFYVDYQTARFVMLTVDAAGALTSGPTEITAQLNPGNAINQPSSFGEDNAGELYICTGTEQAAGSGKLFKIVPRLVIANASPLPATTVGADYSVVLTASNGTGAGRTWTATGLPAGLTLTTGGTLAGHLQNGTAGTATITVNVVDADGAAGSKIFSLTINPALAITTAATLPNGTAGSAYTTTLAASGGTGGKTWAVEAGSSILPLTLSPGGVLAGTPAAGTMTFTVRVTDAVGAFATKALTLTTVTVGGTTAPTITSTAPLRAEVGIAYQYAVTATGSPAPTLTLTVKPAGMTISAGGVIAFTPAALGNVPVTVTASNGTAPDAVQSFTIAVTDFGLADRPLAAPFLGMPDSVAGALPATLTDTGAFSSVPALTPGPALLPYGVQLAFWSDHARKTRWVSVPRAAGTPGQAVAFSANGEWTFPSGTVFVKHFDFPIDDTDATRTRRLETRLIVVQPSGAVYGVTYKWNPAGTEAALVPAGGVTEDVVITTAGGTRTQSWYYPSRDDCLRCHTSAAGFVLGVKARQLNGDFAYPSGRTDNQLRTWTHIGMFSGAPAEGDLPGIATIIPPADTSSSLEVRARSYIDVNCSNCHRPGGAPARFDARFSTALAAQGIVDGEVNQPLGISGAKVVVMGHPEQSILYQRIHTVAAATRMPPVGRVTIDSAGTDLIAQWIGGDPNATPPMTGTTPPASGDGGGKKCGLGAGFAVLSFMLMMIGWRRRLR